MSQEEKDQIVIESFFDTVSVWYSEDNILSTVNEENGITSFRFESGNYTDIATRLIKNSTIDTNTWLGRFEFLDGRFLEIGHVGTRLIIEQKEYEHADLVPLVGLMNIDIPFQGLLEYSVIGKNGSSSDVSSIPVEVTEGPNDITILGLYKGSANEVKLIYSNKDGIERFSDVVTITTDYFLDHLPGTITVVTNLRPEQQRLFLTAHRGCGPESGAASFPFIVDQYGDIRWFAIFNATYAIQRTLKGTILFVNSLTNKFTEISLDGKINNTYEIPSPYTAIHHDIVDLGEGYFILTVNNTELETIEDILILFNAESGLVEKVWDLNESVPKSDVFIKDDRDWFHMNAVDHDYRDNSLIVSGQRFGLVKLSWENSLEWILTDPQRLGDALYDDRYYDKILNSDVGESITWGQHDIRIDEENDLYYLFDNGLGRHYSNAALYSRGVRFTVNPTEKTFRVIKQFGESYSEYYSPIISGIDYSRWGSTLINFGSIGYGFDYISNEDWVGNPYKDNPSIGAAWLEFDADDELMTEIRFSCVDSDGHDKGIYRSRYIDLFSE